ncbi:MULTISPECIES: hypothetical protein [unclassified Streptomyces]|uniref:hypothetical protein n=1 Tax=unclassified Streptomyces TaxID=2593676 RepID=UPI0011B93B08|nr:MULTISPECIES: hypothetical protein [unclassified Streptomyces]
MVDLGREAVDQEFRSSKGSMVRIAVVSTLEKRATGETLILRSSGRLTLSSRVILTCVGAAMIGAGVVTVYKRDGNVGPTTLIVIGAALVVLGTAGR